MKGRAMRRTAAALCLSLLAGMAAGCGGQKEPEELPQQKTGGYTSSDETLAGLPDGSTIKQIYTWEDSVRILTASEEEDVTILREWEQGENGFEDITEEWLKGLELQCGSWADMQLVQDQSKTQYLFVRNVTEEGLYQGQLWRPDGEGAVDITPEKWTVPEEGTGMYEDILGIAVLDDGTLYAVSSRSVDVLDGADGTVVSGEENQEDYGENVLTDGIDLYLVRSGSMREIEEIEKRPGGRSADAETIPLPESGMGEAELCVLRDGTLLCAGKEGIFRYDAAAKSWEKLLEGSETDFSLSTCWCMGMTALADGRVYVLFGQEGGDARLVRYEYDANAVTETERNLTVYTVWENPLLQQAAALYHREHPEVLITVDSVYSTQDQYSGVEPDYDQICQQLNTRLMGEEAPDILVLDCLDTDSYAEKGLLADIGGVVEPLEESGQLLSNITGAYVREGGSRYAVPLQFQFTMAVGRDIPPEKAAGLEPLAGCLAGQQESCLGPMTAEELVDRFYPYFCGEFVKDKKIDRDVLKKNLEYLKAIADNSGILPAREENDRACSIWDLPSQVRLAFADAKGYRSSMTPIAVAEYVEGEFTAFENCFRPSLLMGISAKSEYRDTAEDFLRFALSQDVQDTDFYTGFPVNQASLEKQEQADRSDVMMATTIINFAGQEEIFDIGEYSPETAKKLTDICKALDRPVVEDAKIREELLAALPTYLDGSRTLEETLDSIEDGLRIYLAE